MRTKVLIESLLFISGKPMSAQKLAEVLGKEKDEVIREADELAEEYAAAGRGMLVQKVGSSYQMVTSPSCTHIIKDFIKSEQSGELTKPSLETLTIIAYRGPVTKAELEQIRGVNCSLIIRNLLIKGLIEAHEDREKMATVYSITFDFLRFLGLSKVEELPDFSKLNSDENLKKLLEIKVDEMSEEQAT
ncbi:MAG: SMC-Scp complex subunit ScpB [Patescibacteria group bacterium]